MNEKLNHKKAFTVVELVIVIAIIAVLAAVLIPTFAGLIHSANVSSDKSLVKNLNTALRADEVLNGSNSNIDRALGVSLENGYNIEKLTPTSQGNEIVWDEVNNQFALIKGDQVLYADNESKAQTALSAKTNIWKLITVENVNQVPTDGYSYYLKGDTLTGTANVIAGLSVGKNTGVNVKYERTEGETHNVQFFTNGGDLTVNAPHDDVKHYGAVNALTVEAVNSVHCYHEYGYVGDLVSLGEGKFIAEEGSEFHQTQALIEAVLHGKTADISKAKFDQHSYGEDDRCIHCRNLNPSHVHKWELEDSVNTDTLKFKCGCGGEYTVNRPSSADPNGHTKKHVPAKVPTCTESGNKEYWICSCGKFYASENAGEDDDIPATSVILSAKGHQAGSPEVNETAANCTEAGKRKITVKCTVCGEQLAEKSFPIPALGHTFDKSTHKCTKCDIIDPSWNPVSEKVKNGVLEENAFIGDTKITEAVIPEGVTTIGSNAFKGCTNLKKVTIPDNVTTIGREAFYGCKALTSIEIPDTVTEIASGAFNGCSSLQSIKIPDSVTTIDGKTFYECTALTSITIGKGISSIVINNADNAFIGTNLETIIVSSENATYKSEGNCILTKDGAKLVLGCKKSVIPSTVTTIGNRAFYMCSGLTEIEIPDSVTKIEDYAFASSGLTSIVIPNSVTSIAGFAFNECSKLASATLSANITTIKAGTFTNCIKLTTITIPAKVKKIEKSTFNGSGLNTATFETPSGWKCTYYIAAQGRYGDKHIDLTNSTNNAGYLKGTSQQYPMPSFSRQ